MVNSDWIRDWDIARLLILKKWDKLKSQDLKINSMLFNEVVNIIQQYYANEPKQNIESDLRNLIDQIVR